MKYAEPNTPGSLIQFKEDRNDTDSPIKPQRISWTDLLKRVFQIDLVKCPSCGGEVRFIAAITKKDVITKILGHLNLPYFRKSKSEDFLQKAISTYPNCEPARMVFHSPFLTQKQAVKTLNK